MVLIDINGWTNSINFELIYVLIAKSNYWDTASECRWKPLGNLFITASDI